MNKFNKCCLIMLFNTVMFADISATLDDAKGFFQNSYNSGKAGVKYLSIKSKVTQSVKALKKVLDADLQVLSSEQRQTITNTLDGINEQVARIREALKSAVSENTTPVENK